MNLAKGGWFLVGLVVIAALVGVWGAISNFGLVSRVFLPAPQAVLEALINGWTNGSLETQAMSTINRMITGWGLSSILGVVLGALIGMSVNARAFLQPTLELFRPLPASAMVPVAIAFLGPTNQMVLAVICFGALWPVLLATVYGVSTVDERLRELSSTLVMSRAEFIFKIALPNAMPDILAGVRLAISISLILTVVGEMIASVSGLGQAILFSARGFKTAELYAGVILLGLIGYVTSTALSWLETYVLRYRQ